MRGARVLAVGISLVGLSCCSTDGSTRSGQLSNIQTTMDRYLSALKAGDFSAAMTQRCHGATVADAQRELFLQQAADLTHVDGVESIKVVPASAVHIIPIDRAGVATPFDYEVMTATGSHLLHGVAVFQDGRETLCGYGQEHVDSFAATITAPESTGGDAGRLADLMPSRPPDGMHQVQDGASTVTDSSTADRLESWTRAWARNGFGGVRVTANRFASVADARRSATEAIGKLVGDAVGQFSIAGGSGAVGVRYAAEAWTWVQPADVGPMCDSVHLIYDDMVVVIAACGLRPTDSHAVVEQLVDQVNSNR